MLLSLNIRNLALIEDLTIDFRPGLNVLSGETGAGKSIVIGALGLVLGEKGSAELVRTGAELASIEGLFSIGDNAVLPVLLERNGIDASSGELLVRRTLSPDGRTRVLVNGALANQALLKEIGLSLVDIYGQHEHQSLFRVARHLELLDSFAGLSAEAEALAALRRALAALEADRRSLDMDEREKQRRLELNEFAIREIDAADPKENEAAELAEEARRLVNYEKIYAALDSADGQLGPSGALGQAKGAARALESIAEHDPRAAAFASRCQDAIFLLEDLSDELGSYREHIEFSPGRLDEVNGRLALLQGLMRKYGETPAAVLAYREQCRRENETIGSSEEKQQELEREIAERRSRLGERAFALSARRQEAAVRLEARVMEELAFLGMEKTVFKADIRYIKDEEGFLESEGQRIRLFDGGIDYVEFMISPNPGEALRPLRKIASGGEISRVMLALKNVLGDSRDCETHVFDEVDAGIGGATASAVGRKLREVAGRRQVLCITHLPQIAALADHHLLVQKSVVGGRTRSEVRHLPHDERLAELARMIGGDVVSDTTLHQAQEMIERARAQ